MTRAEPSRRTNVRSAAVGPMFAAVGVVFFASAAYGQPKAPDAQAPEPQAEPPAGNATGSDLGSEDLSLFDLLNMKVSIASRTTEAQVDSPSSVATFTEQDIRNMGV